MNPSGDAVRAQIIDIIKKFPCVSVRCLSEEIGKSITTIKWHLNHMEDAEFIRRSSCECCGANIWIVMREGR